jgi:hypothetical protein
MLRDGRICIDNNAAGRSAPIEGQMLVPIHTRHDMTTTARLEFFDAARGLGGEEVEITPRQEHFQ